MPSKGYSATAQDFVKACVNKIPAKRHTYPMLLAHPWLKPLTHPETIEEDAEGEEAAAQSDGVDGVADATEKLNLNRGVVHDEEVAEWVLQCLDRKAKDSSDSPAANTKTVRPALHAAPLNPFNPVGSGGP